MNRWIGVTGWGVAIVFAGLWGTTLHREHEIERQSASLVAQSVEIMELKRETEARNAQWIVSGLELMRRGESDAGYHVLDTVVASLVKFAQPSKRAEVQELLVRPRRYLEAVGDPRERE